MVISRRTATVCNHSLSLHLFQSIPLDQSRDGMESTAYFEGADALEVFALEEEVHLGPSGLLAFPLCPLECFRSLRLVGESVQGGIGQDGRVMDVRLDEGVGGFDRGARQGGMGGCGGHGCH